MSETGKTIALIEALKGNGGGGGSNKFIVTLTPTALDYSGTMDKTVAEINSAYEAGMEIWFKFSVAGVGDYYAHVFNVFDDEHDYPSFNTYLVLGAPYNIILFVGTVTTDDGTKQTYSTDIHTLTPAS